MYVIKKGAYFVARSGSQSSYSSKVENVKIFETLEEAKRNLCPENERIFQYFPGSIIPVKKEK